MIKRNTEPRNKDFFSRVVPVIPYVIIAGIIFQVISAITEAFGIYQFGSALGSPLFVNLFFTIVVVIGWELLIRVSTNYISKTLTLKLRNEIVMEKLEFVLLFLAILLGGPLIYYSYSVSKENAHMTFEFMIPDRDTTAVTSIVSTKSEELNSIDRTYSKRKNEIEQKFSDQERAEKGIHQANKKYYLDQIVYWQEREKARNKKYTSKINSLNKKINESNQKYQSSLSEITSVKNEELSELKKWRKKTEGSAISFADENLSEDKNKWKTFNVWFKKYSYIWSHFAGLSSILAVLCVLFSVVFKVLAGIEEETHLTPESLEPHLMSEVAYLLHLKTISPLRNKIRTAINKAASERVQLEIVTHSAPTVTHTRYAPTIPEAKTLRSESVTPLISVTESVTESRYEKPVTESQHELPTHVTPVTPSSVTDHGTSAAPKLEPVTPPEAIVVELSPTVTGSKPEKVKTVTDQGPKVVMVGPTKAVITGSKGEKETVTLEQVSSRKRANLGNIKKRKTQNGKDNAKRLYDFYAGLENKIKEAKK